MTDQTETPPQKFTVIGEWLVQETDGCTCFGGEFGQHEQHCGAEPLVKISEIIAVFTGDRGEISDGSHTFTELYNHRHALFITACRLCPKFAWRSRTHDDGTMFPDYFIAGLRLPNGQVNYHLPMKHWDDLDRTMTLDAAPTWDGHSPDDGIARLLAWRPPVYI
jgi:hypothetical protein